MGDRSLGGGGGGVRKQQCVLALHLAFTVLSPSFIELPFQFSFSFHDSAFRKHPLSFHFNSLRLSRKVPLNFHIISNKLSCNFHDHFTKPFLGQHAAFTKFLLSFHQAFMRTLDHNTLSLRRAYVSLRRRKLQNPGWKKEKEKKNDYFRRQQPEAQKLTSCLRFLTST